MKEGKKREEGRGRVSEGGRDERRSGESTFRGVTFCKSEGVGMVITLEERRTEKREEFSGVEMSGDVIGRCSQRSKDG